MALTQQVNVQGLEHNTLNHSKDVIYTNELRLISETEALDDLKT